MNIKNHSKSKKNVLSRKNAEKRFIEISYKTSGRVLSCLVINYVSKILRFDEKNFFLSGISATIVSVTIYIISLITHLLSNHLIVSANPFIVIAIPSMFTGLAFGVIKYMHDITLPPNRERLSNFPYDQNGLQELCKWFDSKFLLKQQLLTSFIFAISTTLSAWILLAKFPDIRNNLGFLFASFSGLFSVGNDVYSATVIPTSSIAISKNRMNLYPLDPSNTTTLQEMTSAFGKLSLATGIFSTILIIIIFLLQPTNSSLAIAAFWLFVGWGTSIYSFVYPVLNLAKAVKREKKLQLELFEIEISIMYKGLKTLSRDHLSKLETLAKMRQTVFSSSDNPLNFSGARNFFVSILMPFASFLVGVLGVLKN